jgi:sirohydrochlorin cobaltochelatase
MTTALVLAGHGSHISPLTAGLVWQQVDQLRAMGVADEVTAAFWKEFPSFATVLNTLAADEVTIVPLFTAQGFFTRNVIPAEMKLTGTGTQRDGRTIRYARTLGEHPFLQEVVRRRVEDTLKVIDASSKNVGVALIGHGTKRNPQSRAATEAQAQHLRDLHLAGQVVAVYLDDTPSIPDMYELLNTPRIIAVPNFLALGSHTTIDVPEAIGLEAGQMIGDVNGRMVYYTDPVGVDESLTAAILELVTQVGANLYPPKAGTMWDAFPTAGRDELLCAVHEQGEIRFGQLILTPSEVRVEGEFERTITTLDDLRDYVRTSPKFRPLSTSNDLPSGWRVLISESEMIHAVVETVYPGAVADWVAQRNGSFTVQTLNEVAKRQQGMFHQLEDFERTAEIVQRVCAGCARQPTWFNGHQGVIPCSEACNLWMSAALEIEE